MDIGMHKKDILSLPVKEREGIEKANSKTNSLSYPEGHSVSSLQNDKH